MQLVGKYVGPRKKGVLLWKHPAPVMHLQNETHQYLECKADCTSSDSTKSSKNYITATGEALLLHYYGMATAYSINTKEFVGSKEMIVGDLYWVCVPHIFVRFSWRDEMERCYEGCWADMPKGGVR